MPLHDVAQGGEFLSLICDQLLTGSQATFDTNTILGGNLPSGYRNLHIVLFGAITAASTNDGVLMQFNGDTGANYHYANYQSNDSGTVSGGGGNAVTSFFVAQFPGTTAPSNSGAQTHIDIANYTGTTFHKVFNSRTEVYRGTAAGNTFVLHYGGAWASTAALTRIVWTPNAGSFATGSRLSVYGY